VNRREQIRMSAAELAAFLEEERTVICATSGQDGFPHLMPLWFVMRGEEIWAWTFAKSQKVRNLERDPRATLQVEAGEDYAQLRGAMLKCDVTLHRDGAGVAALGVALFERYRDAEPGGLDRDTLAMIERQAPKRVALQCRPRATVSWDHRKLAAGVY
jgi:PPOX class probable F420-dependent enzyme